MTIRTEANYVELSFPVALTEPEITREVKGWLSHVGLGGKVVKKVKNPRATLIGIELMKGRGN